MRQHKQQKWDAFFINMLTARLSASMHATMHATMLDACVRRRLRIAVKTESIWNDLKTVFACKHWCSTLFPIFFHV